MRRLSERLLQPATPRALAWRAMGGMYIGAAALVSATLLLGVESAIDVRVIAGLSIVATVAGLAILVLAPWIPRVFMLVSFVAGVVLISAAVVAAGEPDSPYAVFYIWL